MKAISPNEAKELHVVEIPDSMIEVVNELLVKHVNPNSNNQYFSITQKEVIDLYVARFGEKPKWEWLNFEPIYKKQGWNVEYDRPGFNESYGAFWRFST